MTSMAASLRLRRERCEKSDVGGPAELPHRGLAPQKTRHAFHSEWRALLAGNIVVVRNQSLSSNSTLSIVPSNVNGS